jgi:hypothetical protein
VSRAVILGNPRANGSPGIAGGEQTMRDKRNDLRPVADLLIDGEDSPERERTRRKAALAVAARAKDPEDCARLLDMLGLHRSHRRASDVA